MKIKADFITNSSSTAFIVCIPDNWYPSDEVMENASEWLVKDNEEDKSFKGDCKAKIMELFDDLRRGQLVCMDDGIDFYYVLCSCLNDDHIILSFEGGSGGGFVEHIYKEKLLKVLNCVYSGKSLKENISATVLGGGDEN